MIRILGKKKVAKRIFWGLAIVIIPSFVFWGIGDGVRGARRHLAAQVNRKNITREDYNRHLGELLEQRRRFGAEDIEAGTPEMKALQEQALEELIRQELLFQQARRRKISVSDEEVLAQVKSDPAFRDENGGFNQGLFERTVEIVPEEQWLEYEDEIRRSQLLKKLYDHVVAGLEESITAEEIAAYRAEQGFDEGLGDDLLKQFIAYRKKNEAYEAWYKEIREKAKVRIFLE